MIVALSFLFFFLPKHDLNMIYLYSMIHRSHPIYTFIKKVTRRHEAKKYTYLYLYVSSVYIGKQKHPKRRSFIQYVSWFYSTGIDPEPPSMCTSACLPCALYCLCSAATMACSAAVAATLLVALRIFLFSK